MQLKIIKIIAMVNPEQPKEEDSEAETNPEQVVDAAAEEVVSTAEIQEVVDPDASSVGVKNGKEFFRGKGEYALATARTGSLLVLKMIWGTLRFAKKLVEKRGKMSFKEGYEIGHTATSFDDKKQNK